MSGDAQARDTQRMQIGSSRCSRQVIDDFAPLRNRDRELGCCFSGVVGDRVRHTDRDTLMLELGTITCHKSNLTLW